MLLEQMLQRSARLWPEKMAAIDGEWRLTYGQFAERVDRLANALIGLGLAPGERVGVLMLNSFRYLELYYAVSLAGGVIVPLNTRLAIPELSFMLDDCGARLLVAGPEFSDAARRIQAECPSLQALILADDGDAPAGMHAYEHLLAAAGPARPEIAKHDSDAAGIFYTGGTTGRPKGVMLTHRNLVDNAYRAIMHVGYQGDDTYLHAAPMFHLADGASTFAITAIGGTHAHIRAFDPPAVLATLEREQVTSVLLVPTMINALVNCPDSASCDLSRLRRVVYGASPIAESTLRRGMEFFGCAFIQGFGMTEVAPILTILSEADHRLGLSERPQLLRSAGQAGIGIDLRVVDDDDRDLPPGVVGEVIARGDNVMLGYWQRPEETAAALRGGCYHSGDLATMDEEGYVYIVDRKKDMIVSGGENVYSIEVENALANHPAVLECAVIGVPDDRWGEAVLAVVVPRPGRQPEHEELIDHCRRQIAGYKVPRAIVLADSLPKSGAGKILKREIREQYWREESRRVH
ncbi:MAG TPA: long-chain-fatty-acid--CoA ligase [Thermomicrobiaceae bacterium]|nr:long-chain-fatty-acid--CoA ligase [Thermomicrobiaceae bacterium]